ncbi:MAG: hypothetical protein J7J98_00710 [candidate division Zixibacteria bacterium]|nr:hypothetical protein [candidate division Zixibacteria bacterium]
MKLVKILLGSATLIVAFAFAVQADNSGRIYGEIETVDGETFEGLIRWDKNEGSWVDILDGTRDRDDRDTDRRRSKRRSYRSQRSNINLFGINIGGSSNIYFSSSNAQSGIRFGHISRLEVLDDDRALLVLKSGNEVEFYNGSTDIGSSIREIVIEDVDEGEIEFTWDDIEIIEFSEADNDEPSSFGERLYGTLTTRRGDEFTGFVCWDVDELFENDVLDGDEKRRSRKIRFGKIASIARYSSSGAEVVLKSGDKMLLRGSNDVDDDNRGIIISDPAFGQIRVEWDEFDKIEFKKAPRSVPYSAFDGGKKIKGTVYTEDGDKYTGEICWDDDEQYTWEILDGDHRDNEYEIEFGLIKEIEKNSRRTCDITVSDGRVFTLGGSNDVDGDNKGIIIIEDNGDDVYVDWEDFARAVFVK